MSQQNYSGYICTDAERMARRYAPAWLVVMQLIACFFFFQAFRNSDGEVIGALLVGWIVFTIWLIVSYFRIRVVDRLAFSLEKRRLTNTWPKNNKIELDLRDGYFCAQFTCEFAYGKASTEKIFYLFSANPFASNSIKGVALRALENIHKNNIIIIPKTDTTSAWIKDNLHLGDIPEYPSAIWKQSDWPWDKDNKTGDGLREPY